MQKKPEVSIIIVHYKVPQELFDCIQSVIKTTQKVSYEIIVVDNDETPIIEKDLKKKFPQVIYMHAKENVGWGLGTMVGVAKAKGAYLYFLNPDCIILGNAIDQQYTFIKNTKNVGVVSSRLVDRNKNPFPLQGTQILTPFRALFSLSLINKVFPNNPIAKAYWLKGIDRKKVQQVDVAPLSSAIISKTVFEQVGGFHKDLFLYFEEFDLGQKIKKAGLKSYILPDASVIHLWGASSKKRSDTSAIFRNSRYVYFKTHYGTAIAWLLKFL